MTTNRIFIGFIFSFLLQNCLSQDIDYARDVIDTLASKEMFGRGYVNNGDTKAATFIFNEFSNLKLKSFESNYYQHFDISVNTLPGIIKLKLNGKELIPGTDYLVSSASSSTFGIYKPLWFTKKNIKSTKTLGKFLDIDFSDKIIIADKKGIDDEEKIKLFEALHYQNYFKAKGVINITDSKLTWDVASGQYQQEGFLIDLKRMKIKKKSEFFVHIDSKFVKNHQTQNVIAFIKGKVYPETYIVFTAHYDHLGGMGSKVFFPGANDNASGIAMLLNLAKFYSESENYPDCSIVFIAFAAEEMGILGSKYFNEHPLFPLENIKFLFNLDLVGTGDDGIMVVNGKNFPEKFDLLVQINNEKKYLPAIKKRGEAMNSDHHYFHKNNVPAFFIYTLGGISEYHNPFDRAETIPLTEFEDLFRLITEFVTKL